MQDIARADFSTQPEGDTECGLGQAVSVQSRKFVGFGFGHRRLPVGWRAQGAPAVQSGQIDPGVINAAIMMVKTVGGEVGGEDRDLRSGIGIIDKGVG